MRSRSRPSTANERRKGGSAAVFVRSLRVSPGRPAAPPGGLRAGCRAYRALMARLRRYSAARMPLRGGEWGLLWYRSLAASFSFSSPVSEIFGSSPSTTSWGAAISVACSPRAA